LCNIGVATASVAFRKAFSPLHGSLYEMEAEPQLNAAFMPQLALGGLRVARIRFRRDTL
jgi:hypothetical protein